MADEMKLYPHGSIAMGNGDLIQVINVKLDFKNGAKLKHTLRKTPSGVTIGTKECSVSFDFEVDEDGEERDYMEFCQAGTIKQLRLKIPGKTYTVNGVYDSVSIEAPLDDAVKGSCNFIGRLER